MVNVSNFVASISSKSTGLRPWTHFQTLTLTGTAEDKAKEAAVEAFFGALEDEAEVHALLIAIAALCGDPRLKEVTPEGKQRVTGLRLFRRPVRLLFSNGARAVLPAQDPVGYLLTWADVLYQSPAGLRDYVEGVRDKVRVDATAYDAHLADWRAQYDASKA